ncbi:Serine/threonine protein phosphatase [Handroanthus impetiginosus]|uniref:protein-serine/threonine phosphatase n=1 Tax=Handroanthus impetiginosus TaxID=429701 RepID=A0A2G9G5L4_9LAMI|nr:Serine/threonine protein phosphatase [Handroanthus impetiginosus]
MLAEAELMCTQSVAVQYLCAASPAAAKIDADFFDVSPPPTSRQIKSPVFSSSESAVSIELSCSELALSCSTSIQTTAVLDTLSSKFAPRIRSGSHTDVGPRRSNEDQHIRIDDLSTHLGSLYSWSQPSSFYAIFDGHGGADAAVYLKNNALRFFFEEAELPQTSDVDEKFLQALETSHRRSFLLADRALADEQNSVNSDCGTTVLTALVLGRHLLVANAGDCRAVLCRKGDAVQLSQDHRPSCQVERKRVEDLGGKVECGYLNGELALTRALGDWYMKLPYGSASPLTAEPELQQTLLTEDDEFLIIGCDGIWDVLSNQEAVALVRRELRHHNDPQQCARELINQALRRDTCDNITAIVVCFSSQESQEPVPSRRSRFRICMSEEARNKLRSLIEDN